MTATAYGYLAREMEKRGLRVYASFINLTEEEQKRDDHAGPRSWDQVYDNYPNFRFKVQHFDEGATPQWSDDWEEAAGGFADSIKAMGPYFAAGVDGRYKHGLKTPFFDWLACSLCGEVRMSDRGNGAPSARVRCGMTPNCEGLLTRLPDVYEVIIKHPPKKAHPNRRKLTEDGQPVRRGVKGYSKEVRDEALRLKATGMGLSDVARALARLFPEGHPSISTVKNWTMHKEIEDGSNNAS